MGFQNHGPPEWFFGTDASEWAKAFIALCKGTPGMERDEGFMIGWFANAIQRGTDSYVQNHMTPQREDLKRLSESIGRHIERHSAMPVRASEMTDNEHALFQMLAADRGLLTFLQKHLLELAVSNVKHPE